MPWMFGTRVSGWGRVGGERGLAFKCTALCHADRPILSSTACYTFSRSLWADYGGGATPNDGFYSNMVVPVGGSAQDAAASGGEDNGEAGGSGGTDKDAADKAPGGAGGGEEGAWPSLAAGMERLAVAEGGAAAQASTAAREVRHGVYIVICGALQDLHDRFVTRGLGHAAMRCLRAVRQSSIRYVFRLWYHT